MAGRFAKSISLTVSTALSFITGDIQVFQACRRLVELSLNETKVHGDIQAFHSNEEIVHLDLANTKARPLRIPIPSNVLPPWNVCRCCLVVCENRLRGLFEGAVLSDYQQFGCPCPSACQRFVKVWDKKKVHVPQPLRSHLMIFGTNWWTKSCATGAGVCSSNVSRYQQRFCCNWQVSGDIKILETALELAYIDLSGTKVQGPQMLATNFSCLIFAANELLVTAIWMFVLYCLGILKLLVHLASHAHRSQRNKQHPVPFFFKANRRDQNSKHVPSTTLTQFLSDSCCALMANSYHRELPLGLLDPLSNTRRIE